MEEASKQAQGSYPPLPLPQTECFNHVRLLQRLNATHLYACGTHAFQPLCAAIVSAPVPGTIIGPCPWAGLTVGPASELPFPQDAETFTLPTSFEEGKEKCPYDPARGFTGLIIGEHALPPHASLILMHAV